MANDNGQSEKSSSELSDSDEEKEKRRDSSLSPKRRKHKKSKHSKKKSKKKSSKRKRHRDRSRSRSKERHSEKTKKIKDDSSTENDYEGVKSSAKEQIDKLTNQEAQVVASANQEVAYVASTNQNGDKIDELLNQEVASSGNVEPKSTDASGEFVASIGENGSNKTESSFLIKSEIVKDNLSLNKNSLEMENSSLEIYDPGLYIANTKEDQDLEQIATDNESRKDKRSKSRSTSREASSVIKMSKSRNKSESCDRRSRSKRRSKRRSRSKERRSRSNEKRSRSKGRSRSKEKRSRSKDRTKERSRSNERRWRSKERRSKRKRSRSKEGKSKEKSGSRSRERSRDKSAEKSKQMSKDRSEETSTEQSRKRSRSTEKSREALESKERAKEGSKERTESNRSEKKSRERSEEKSRQQDDRQLKERSKRSRSRGISKEKQSPDRKYRSRDRSHSRQNSRSSSKGHGRSRSRERRRSRSGERRRSRSREHRRSRSRERRRSRSLERRRFVSRYQNSSRFRRSTDRQRRSRSKSVGRRRYSRSPDRRKRSHSRSINRSHRSRSRNRYRSRSPRKYDRSSDRKRRSNSQDAAASVPVNLTIALGVPTTSVTTTTADEKPSKSIADFTALCKKLTQSKEDLKYDVSKIADEDENVSQVYHPFNVKPAKEIVIPPVILPVAKPTEPTRPLEQAFPVSRGNQHKTKENTNEAVVEGVDGSVAAAEEVFQTATQQEKLDVSGLIVKRMEAQNRLQANPHDYEAKLTLEEVQMKIQNWASVNLKPGQYTGESLVSSLAPKENINSGYQAWARKDMFHNLAPIRGGVGMRLLQKMGWRPGQVIGKRGEGSYEPIALSVKTDRKGLVSFAEMGAKGKGGGKGGGRNVIAAQAVQGKHPVSALAEICTKKRWKTPEYVIAHESGPSHKKDFLYKVIVNGNSYQHNIASNNKKLAKAEAAFAALKALGVVPADAAIAL